VHEFQHCRTLFAAGKVLGCRAGLAFDGAFATPLAAAPESYELTLRSSASAAVDRGRRGQGRLRGEANFSLRFDVPTAGDAAEVCLQRDRYIYHPNGPSGGLSELGATESCERPIEASFKPHADDLLSAYDQCEARQAWGSEIEGVTEVLAAGLFYLAAPSRDGNDRGGETTNIVAPYVTIRAPLAIDCRD
jgi:hypothetical protein